MTYHPQVGLGNIQETGQIRAGPFIIESHDDYGAFALFQILHTTPELIVVDARHNWLDRRRELCPELFEQASFLCAVRRKSSAVIRQVPSTKEASFSGSRRRHALKAFSVVMRTCCVRSSAACSFLRWRKP